MAIFETSDLAKEFGGLRALDSVSVSVDSGELVGLIGPNGAGKTTFFNCVTGFLEPTDGTVYFRDEEVTGLPAHELPRRGMVRTFQHSRALGTMTVRENVKLPALDHPGERAKHALLQTAAMDDREADIDERATELMDRFDLLEKEDQYASQLSGGERKLLEIARALITDPELLLLDEPYAGIDEMSMRTIADYVRELNDEGVTFIVIEHGLEALVELVERLVVLHDGAVIADGDPETVIQDPQVVEVYLGSQD